LGKPIGPESDYAESWEICDHGDDQSVIAEGGLKGVSLGTLIRERGKEIFGRHDPQPSFPLLIKYLDARQDLSLQVHPNDAQAAKLTPPDNGKTEAWYVLHAEPGSTIYAGLKPGVDRRQLEESLRSGKAADLLHRIEARAGDFLFVPAGTVHALGRGLLVAEVQQSSDVTYRLFDWNRLGPDGKPRQLHVEQGLAAVDFSRGPVEIQKPLAMDKPGLTRLVECEKFVLDRWEIDSPAMLGGDDRFHIVMPLEGELRIAGDPIAEPLKAGETCLLPAGLGGVEVIPSKTAKFLDVYLPFFVTGIFQPLDYSTKERRWA
jgi:mannose-6-phosphate isomerase